MRRLTRTERDTLKRMVSEARFAKTHPSKGLHGLAESCFHAAHGDPLLALALASDAIRMKRDWKPKVQPALGPRQRHLPPERRVTYEEMFS